MKLAKAFEISLDYLGHNDPIRIDVDGYLCLTDMVKYFPNKRLDNWMVLKSTKDFIEVLDKSLNTLDSRDLKNGNTVLKRKRGKYEGGTYAHELLALEFATWLSPEFKLKVYSEYQNGTQRKDNWNIKRILASFNYKLMSQAVQSDHEDPKFYHYSNEAKMINKIIFNKSEKGIRETATEYQLDLIAKIEGHNATLIGIGMNFSDRKEKLSMLLARDLALTGLDISND